MKQWHNVIQVPSSVLEQSLLNVLDESNVENVVDGHGMPVLYLTVPTIAWEEDDGH